MRTTHEGVTTSNLGKLWQEGWDVWSSFHREVPFGKGLSKKWKKGKVILTQKW